MISARFGNTRCFTTCLALLATAACGRAPEGPVEGMDPETSADGGVGALDSGSRDSGALDADAFVARDPQWTQSGSDQANTGRSPYVGPQTPRLEWDVVLDAAGGLNVVLDARGVAYMLGYGAAPLLMAVDEDGVVLWRAACDGCGSSIAVDSTDTLYVGGQRLRAFDTGTGDLKWELDVPGRIEGALSLSDDGTVQFGSGEEDGPAYFHVVRADGSTKWSSMVAATGTASASAVAPDGTIVVTGDRLRALRPADGSLLWELDIGGLGFIFGPAIADDGTIYVPSNSAGDDGSESRLYAIAPDGTVKWELETGFLELTPAVGTDGTVYFHNYGGGPSSALPRGVYALNPDGSVKWTFDIVCPAWSFNQNAGSDSSPTIDPEGTLYFGSECGTVFAVNPDGTEKWRFGVDGEFDNRPSIDADGRLHICHAGGGPQDWWRLGYRCYAIGDAGRILPEPASVTPYAFCEQGCIEDGSAASDCALSCTAEVQRQCTVECQDFVEMVDRHRTCRGECALGRGAPAPSPPIPGLNNQPCTAGTESGLTCDTLERCSSGELVEGCCILGTCSGT